MKERQDGQILVIFAVAVLAIIAFVGLAIDFGVYTVEHYKAQLVADEVALLSAKSLVLGGDYRSSVQQYLAERGFDRLTNWQVDVEYPPRSGDYQGNRDYVWVRVRVQNPLYFIRLFYTETLEFETTAVAKIRKDEGQLLVEGGSLIASHPGDCRSFQSLDGAQLTVFRGSIFVNSSCSKTNDGALYMSGAPKIEVLNGGQILVVGGYYKPRWSGILSPLPQTNVSPMTFDNLPEPDCNNRANFSSDPSYAMTRDGRFPGTGSVDAYPGVYPNGIQIGNGVKVTFRPGLYCVSGDFVMGGGAEVYGQGVVFVMRGGNLQITDGVKVELWSPQTPSEFTTADGQRVNYQGMLFLGNPARYSSSRNYIFDGGNKTVLVGTIYAPSKVSCLFRNGSATDIYDNQTVCERIVFSGGVDARFYFNPDHYFRNPSTGNLLSLER